MVNVVTRRCARSDHNWLRESNNVHEIPFANYRLDTGEFVCKDHFYAEVNSTCRAIRREVVALGELLCVIPGYLGLTHEEFNEYFLGHDFNLQSCKLIRRPDMLFNFEQLSTNIGTSTGRNYLRSNI